MKLLIASLIGYLLGSIPFAFVIGKVFYHTDVRQHGSGNLGGSNTGRVLGSKAGLSVMTLDLLKVTLSVFLAVTLSDHPWAAACGATAAGLGHCYPIFAKFRGGKAVASLYGFLFSLWVCLGYSPLMFFLPLVTFLLVLVPTKIVSLSSILSSAAAVLYVWLLGGHLSLVVTTAVYAVVIILRHRGNIQRMLSGTERKISWLK